MYMVNKKTVIITFFVFIANILCAAAIFDRNPPQSNPVDASMSNLTSLNENPQNSNPEPPSRAEQVMKAISQAYPDRVGPAVFRDGDWAVSLGGQYYYYAEGRLLPENLKHRVQEYTSVPFYNYPAELPAWTVPTAEETARMRSRTESLNQPVQASIGRSQYFFETLWRSRNSGESWDRVKQIRLFGHSVMLHYSILSQISLVEERILTEARTNTAVRQWIDSIGTVTGWNWRNIPASQSRSFHAYGAAIDILPRTQSGEVYWQWTAKHIPDWWTVPYSRRYHPPPEVIRAFESFGFVWGGKWLFFDTMHFEYRPEVILMNDIPLLTHIDMF